MPNDILKSPDAWSLLERFSSGNLVSQGCLHVVSLETIRERFGSRWTSKSETVWDYVEKQFQKDFLPVDSLVRVNDDAFIVAQPSQASLTAEGKALNFLNDILSFFLGASPGLSLAVGRVVHIGPGVIEHEPVRAGGPGDARSAAEEFHERPLIGTPTLTRLSGSPVIEILPLTEPVWSVNTRAIVSYRLHRQVFTDTDEQRRTLLNMEEASVRDLTRIDIGTLDRTAELLERLPSERRVVIHTPIHEQTLGSQNGRQLLVARLEAMRPLSDSLILCLWGLSAGTPHGRLFEAAGVLDRFCRGVVAVTPDVTFDVSRWSGTRLTAVALDMSDHEQSQVDLATKLQRFATRARTVAPASVAYSISSRATVLAAWSAGFTHLAGDAFLRAVTGDLLPIRFEPADLYPEAIPDGSRRS